MMEATPSTGPKERNLPIFAPWAIALVAIAIGAFLFLRVTKDPPSSSGSITKIFVFQQPGVDRVMVGVEVSVKNETDQGLLVRDVKAKTKVGDDELTDAPAAAAEHERYFKAYPEFKQSDAPPLKFETRVPPGQETRGLLIFGFPVSKEKFDKRSGFEVGIGLYGRPPLVLHQ